MNFTQLVKKIKCNIHVCTKILIEGQGKKNYICNNIFVCAIDKANSKWLNRTDFLKKQKVQQKTF